MQIEGSYTGTGILKNEDRCKKLVNNAINTFALDLSGLIVLTEAATGYYLLTPVIAAIAGAKRVYALTRDSLYGKAVDVRDKLMQLAERWSIANRIEVVFSRESPLIGQADIVTNLGFVRPLDAAFLRRLKATAVIPLMWETWEYRPEELDLAECRRLGIPVLGTNEHHPDLRIFEYIGHIALKLLFALEIEIFRSRVAVIGSGKFAEQVLTTLRDTGAEITLLSTQVDGVLNSAMAHQVLQQAEAVVVVEPHISRSLIGPRGEISANELYMLNPSLVIAHICGGVDRASLEAVGFRCYPNSFAAPGHMSVATDYVGPRPLIDLHTAGLKVGELLARARTRGGPGLQAELKVLRESPLAQGFPGYHDLEELAS